MTTTGTKTLRELPEFYIRCALCFCLGHNKSCQTCDGQGYVRVPLGDVRAALQQTPQEPPRTGEKIRSLNQTITELVAYRYALRTVAESLLKYAEDTYPLDPSSSHREMEEADRRKRIIAEAKKVLYETVAEPEAVGQRTVTSEMVKAANLLVDDWTERGHGWAEGMAYEITKLLNVEPPSRSVQRREAKQKKDPK
jgi:hypothetical protein